MTVAEEPDDDVLRRLREGVQLDDGPARVKRIQRSGRGHHGPRLQVVLLEGRNREVRRLFDAVGHPVVRLDRTRFGPIRVDGLTAGRWRVLDAAEVEALRRTVDDSKQPT